MIMLCVCMALMGWALGAFSVVFFLAWLDERSDRYAAVAWSREHKSPYHFP